MAHPRAGGDPEPAWLTGDELDLFREAHEAIESDEVLDGLPAGWRLEKNSNGQWRLRWQVKDNAGVPVTYRTKSGNIGYKRGSRYVNKSTARRISRNE